MPQVKHDSDGDYALSKVHSRVLVHDPRRAHATRPTIPKVFVLTESKKADQDEALKRVRELALSRCGVEVQVAPWLEGRRALDEFLDNHRRVLDHIIRHRLACGMW